MTAAGATATAAVFTWLGMVVAISFLEAPLKFRAPGVTVRIGLGIGRLVFRGLNIAEAILATVLLVSAAAAAQLPPARVIAAGATAITVLLVQLAVVRPRLSRRSDRVLAGEDVPRSHAHYAYVGLELVKVAALLATGIFLLATGRLARGDRLRRRARGQRVPDGLAASRVEEMQSRGVDGQLERLPGPGGRPGRHPRRPQ